MSFDRGLEDLVSIIIECTGKKPEYYYAKLDVYDEDDWRSLLSEFGSIEDVIRGNPW